MEEIRMEKIKVGLLTMSDGREYLHQDYIQLNMDYQRDIKEALESTGLFQVTAGDRPVFFRRKKGTGL